MSAPTTYPGHTRATGTWKRPVVRDRDRPRVSPAAPTDDSRAFVIINLRRFPPTFNLRRHDFLKQMYRYMVISFGDNGLASYGKRMEIDLVDGEDDLTNGMCVNMYGLKGESTERLRVNRPPCPTSEVDDVGDECH